MVLSLAWLHLHDDEFKLMVQINLAEETFSYKLVVSFFCLGEQVSSKNPFFTLFRISTPPLFFPLDFANMRIPVRTLMVASLEPVVRKTKKKKRKRSETTSPKLLVGDSVEVRSTEEGLKGSWRSGKIIESANSTRLVRYSKNLDEEDNETDFLHTDLVEVSPTIEGVYEIPDPNPLSYRGFIRPQPPRLPIQQWDLSYGLCVDAFCNDAWWEGVIFYHDDGSDERLVFFPDMGGQRMTKFEDLRITQDWDEVSEQWKPRGRWVFLELIEENEIEWPLFVSVAQLWYDLSVKEEFRKNVKMWTCLVKSMWNDLVMEVLLDNLLLTAEHAKSVIEGLNRRTSGSKLKFNSSHRCVRRNPVITSQWLPDAAVVSYLHDAENRKCNSKAMPYDKTLKLRKHLAHIGWKVEFRIDRSTDRMRHRVRYVDPHGKVFQALIDVCKYLTETTEKVQTLMLDNFRQKMGQQCYGASSPCMDILVADMSEGEEAPKDASFDIEYEPEYYPSVLKTVYELGPHVLRMKGPVEDLRLKARNHLLAMDWRFYYVRRPGVRVRYELRYISPSGTRYASLRQACKACMDEAGFPGSRGPLEGAIFSKETKPKLLVGESVEVRSTKEGFQGSWHSAEIIESRNSTFTVRYYNILVNDKRDFHTNLVQVKIPDPIPVSYRGSIRPQPPPLPTYQWGLPYGICVDVFLIDAWWEGVIFDHRDETIERLVFFPDTGDQQIAKLGSMRITQDWDEVSGQWKPRGNWLFLDLIEEHEMDFPLFVSVRQLWFDLKFKEGFRNSVMEWTCLVRSMWKDLVIEVLLDNLLLTAKYAASVIKGPGRTTRSKRNCSSKLRFNSSCRYVPRNQLENFGAECDIDSSDLRAKRIEGNASADVNSGSLVQKSTALRFRLKKREKSNGSGSEYYALPCVGDPGPSSSFLAEDDDGCFGSSNIVGPEPKYRPAFAKHLFDAEYTKPISINMGCEESKLQLRMHLSKIGWKFECVIDKSRYRTREKFHYIDPSGKVFYTLRQVCKCLTETTGLVVNLISDMSEEEIAPRDSSSDVEYEPQCSPSALKTLYELGPHSGRMKGPIEDLRVKAKKHLSAMNWRFYYITKPDLRCELRYISPAGKTYATLRTACKACMDETGIPECTRPVEGSTFSKDGSLIGDTSSSPLASTGIMKHVLPIDKQTGSALESGNEQVKRIETSRNFFSKLEKSRASTEEAINPSREVLYSLIHSGMVLPGAKVCYTTKDQVPLAEGRITREGIICSCCQKGFGISSFVFHAGADDNRSEKNIYLDDGRSLLDCRKQLLELQYNELISCPNPNHFVEPDQSCIKEKEKNTEINSASHVDPIDSTKFDVSDFFVIPGERMSYLPVDNDADC